MTLFEEIKYRMQPQDDEDDSFPSYIKELLDLNMIEDEKAQGAVSIFLGVKCYLR